MSFNRLWERLREDPEWLLLSLFVLVVLAGGAGLYVYDRYRTASRASEAFHRSMGHYNRAMSRGDYEPAVRNHQEYLRRFPASEHADKVLFFLGKLHFARGEYEPALRQFRRLVEGHPDSFFHGAALLHMGYGEMERGRPQRALRWFDRLRESSDDPGEPLASERVWQRALALRATGDTAAAREALRQIDPAGTAASEPSYWTRYAPRLSSGRPH